LCTQPSNITVIKLRMRWVVHVARKLKLEIYTILSEDIKGRNHFVHVAIEWRLILKWFTGWY